MSQWPSVEEALRIGAEETRGGGLYSRRELDAAAAVLKELRAALADEALQDEVAYHGKVGPLMRNRQACRRLASLLAGARGPEVEQR